MVQTLDFYQKKEKRRRKIRKRNGQREIERLRERNGEIDRGGRGREINKWWTKNRKQART